MTATQEIEDLKARLAAAKAHTGSESMSPLLVSVADALRHARTATAPTTTTPIDEAGGHTGKPTSRPPGGVNPLAARARRSLETTIGRAVSAYWSKVLDDYTPLPPAARATTKELGTVRCRTRGCAAENKRIPRHIETGGGSAIEMVHCPACRNKLAT
jgi:hypothetical protein